MKARAWARCQLFWHARVRRHEAVAAFDTTSGRRRLIYAKCQPCNRLFYATPEGLKIARMQEAIVQALNTLLGGLRRLDPNAEKEEP